MYRKDENGFLVNDPPMQYEDDSRADELQAEIEREYARQEEQARLDGYEDAPGSDPDDDHLDYNISNWR